MSGIEYVILVFGTILLIVAAAADSWHNKK
jgi:hypothetical protein